MWTEGIQAAIDYCFKSGGGEVVVPAGDYITGGIRLRSNVKFKLSDGAHLIGSRNPAVACGLGEIGWSKMLLTPEFGPLQRVAFIFTDAELEYDEMYSGERRKGNTKGLHSTSKILSKLGWLQYGKMRRMYQGLRKYA